jgi:hypothetical protein
VCITADITERAGNTELILRRVGECVGIYCGLNIVWLSYKKKKYKGPQCCTGKLRARRKIKRSYFYLLLSEKFPFQEKSLR